MSTELTVIAPKSIEEATGLSATLAKSALLPSDLRGKPADVLVTVLAGAELGLAPMQSLRGIVVIKGKPTLSADTMGALVKRRTDVCKYLQLVESSPTKATYETQRVGEPKPTTITFTMEDAARAQLGGDNWRKYPTAMLRARALSAICRAVYPDLCLGLYDPDELRDEPQHERKPERDVTPAPLRVVESKPAKSSTVIVDVQPGETEEAALARAKLPDPWTSINEAASIAGLDARATGSLVREVTGKTKRSDLTTEDAARVLAELQRRMEAQHAPPDEPQPEADVAF